jgi:predicted secreted protein
MSIIRLALIVTLGVLSLDASAGDAATPRVLGFSADGTMFAFEEYGIQDGSGFPYANRFYIDTANDSFVAGTPIRIRIDDEAAGVDAARAQAREKGDEIVAEAVLSAHPGDTAGWNAITELSSDPFRMVVNPRPIFPPVDSPVEFRLEEIPFAPPSGCENLGDTMGFRLVRINPEPGGETVLVHVDASIPASRHCPTGYRIGGVQTFYPLSGAPVFAVLIAVQSIGFEGPDFRWIAVTGRL